MATVTFLLMALPCPLAAQDCGGLVSSNVEMALSRGANTESTSLNRIIGGQRVPIEGLPWQVLLQTPVIVVSVENQVHTKSFFYNITIPGTCEVQNESSTKAMRRSYRLKKLYPHCCSLN